MLVYCFHRLLILLILVVGLNVLGTGCSPSNSPSPESNSLESGSKPWFKQQPQAPLFPGEEKWFSVLYELSNHGENAEAYFSWDSRMLVYQATVPPYACDQQYLLNLITGERKRLSHGLGRTTCGYFFPDNQRLLYSSTEHVSPACPPRPDYSKGYVWALYDYDIYWSDIHGESFQPLFQAPGYQAEATLSRDGRIVFTSDHEGDLDLYVMEPDYRTIHKVMSTPGYDGGAFFSNDGKRLVFRGDHPQGQELEEYFTLLKTRSVRPTHLEIYIKGLDGSPPRQLTDNGAANFAPYFSPNDEYVIFASNLKNPRSRDFDLYMVSVQGGNPVPITTYEGFDGFPMISHDCRFLSFSSNRTERKPGQTNIYIAELTPQARSLWCSENGNMANITENMGFHWGTQ